MRLTYAAGMKPASFGRRNGIAGPRYHRDEPARSHQGLGVCEVEFSPRLR